MMHSIRTPLSKVLPSVTTPIVLGAMAGASGGDLAGAVSKAGGFGFIGGGYYTPETMQAETSKAYAQLGVSGRDQLMSKKERADFGIGMLTWRLTELDEGKRPPTSSDEPLPSAPQSKAMALIDQILLARPRALWLSFGDDQEMAAWKQCIQRRDAQLNPDIVQGPSIKWFIMVGQESDLKCAVETLAADVLIVQGNEAGGHGNSRSPPRDALLAAAHKHLPSLKPTNATGKLPPILGAGGLSDGRSLASLLTLGCDGGVFGTRFVLTPESQYSEPQKQALIKAKFNDTIRTFAFDDARGTLGWPEGTDGRGTKNLTVDEYERDVLEARRAGKVDDGAVRRMERYKQAAKDADTDRIVIWAGTGVGSMNSLEKAEDLVRQITKETVEAIQQVSKWIES